MAGSHIGVRLGGVVALLFALFPAEPALAQEKKADNAPGSTASTQPDSSAPTDCESAETTASQTNIFGLSAAPIDDDLITDRPDFTESSQTVPRGRGQLEMGYTYTYDSGGGERTQDHTYPEMLLRVGLVDDIELRLAWTGWSHTEVMHKERIDDRWTRVEDRTDGCNDAGVGFKFHLFEQKGLRPDFGVIAELSLPSGADELSSGDFDSGIKLLWSYDVTDCCYLAGNINLEVPTSENGRFFQTSASLAFGGSLTDQLGAYVEYFGFYPNDRGSADAQYVNGGFTYLITNNLQADIRVGMGLNEEADDLFSGVGLAWRF